MLELDYEAAARKLCALRGVNPNTMVNYLRGEYSNPHQVPAWRNAEDEIRTHEQVQKALNSSWVLKQELGKPVEANSITLKPEDYSAVDVDDLV